MGGQNTGKSMLLNKVISDLNQEETSPIFSISLDLRLCDMNNYINLYEMILP